MADEDEIDILGDFSFNSCLAQNNQGIPSCSDREDTVHPQWLLDSTATNWYDIQNRDNNRAKEGPSRKLSGYSSSKTQGVEVHTAWSQAERDTLHNEMAKYGRNIRKISQTLKTKTEAEIQALIEAEHGIHLDTPLFGLEKDEDHDDIPAVVQEEIVTDDIVNMNNVLNMVATGTPTIQVPKKPFRKKDKNKFTASTEVFYDNEQNISTQYVGEDAKHLAKQRVKDTKKIGNHRRKVSRNYDNGRVRNRSKDLLKSPGGRQRKDSGLSDDSAKSPKMQIVFSSGQALPVSEGEQVIKIEKKKESEGESDIEIDIDSDNDNIVEKRKEKVLEEKTTSPEVPIGVPLRKFEPMPKRNRKLPLDGGGGYTIMHTAAGDLYAVGAEPRKERVSRKPPVQLLHCKLYNADKPAPCELLLCVSALISMDVHAHQSRGEVMGLLGGGLRAPRAPDAPPPVSPGHPAPPAHPPRVRVRLYRPAAAAAHYTHCDMDPVSQAEAADSITGRGHGVCGWHHSHPRFAAAPSLTDLRSQRALQALPWRLPFLALVTSQHWPHAARAARAASLYRCFRVEDQVGSQEPVGYQIATKLEADLTPHSLPALLRDLAATARDPRLRSLPVDMNRDVCPDAGLTYLEKCISSVSHHMRSAGYADDDPLVHQLVQGIRDVFR